MVFYRESNKTFYQPNEWSFSYRVGRIMKGSIELRLRMDGHNTRHVSLGEANLSKHTLSALVEELTHDMVSEVGEGCKLLNVEGLALKVQEKMNLCEKRGL